MRRAAIVLALVAACGTLLFALGGAGGGSDYRIRAIFDNAAFLIEGEDVKVAGVTVGVVEELGITADEKAFAVMRIDDPGFQDFRSDALCAIRPQSLIGEKFVDCQLTEPKSAGEPAAPPLPEIAEGRPGAGQRLLGVQRTRVPVDIDLVTNIQRSPFRERLSLILNELGAGVAGNGKALNETIRRAVPALDQTGRVLRILGEQERVLERLARDSDRALAPLAARRAEVADFVDKAAVTARATAQKRGELERTIERLPALLRELKPTMVRLGALSDEMTPVLSDLGDAAPDLNRLIVELGPFSKTATVALEELGDASVPGIRGLTAAQPIARDLRRFGSEGRPLIRNLRQITESLRDTGGIERALDYVFFQVAAINGFDSIGHYLRAGLIVNLCALYAVDPVSGCGANFIEQGAEASSARGGSRDEILARTRAVLGGADADDVLRRSRGRGLRMPRIELPGTARSRERARPAPERRPASAPDAAPAQGLLDYLFGGDG